MLTMFVALSLQGAIANAQPDPSPELPNPYKTTAPWGTLPAGQTWGALNGVDIDKDGESVWMVSRCGANPEVLPGESAFPYDSCAGSTVAPVMKFDSSGKLLISFGAGMFIFPHKIHADRDGNVWVADARGINEREKKKFPGETGKGHTVVKFSPDGTVLLTLGKAGVAGDPPTALTEPTSVVVAPNGDIFVSERHGGQAPDAKPDTVSRISRSSPRTALISSRSASSAPARANSGCRTTSRWMAKDASLSPTAATCAFRSSTRTTASSPSGSSSAGRAASISATLSSTLPTRNPTAWRRTRVG